MRASILFRQVKYPFFRFGTIMNPPVEKVIVAHCGPRGEARSVDHAKELAQMRSHFPSADYEELFSFLMEWKKVDVAIKKYQAFLEWAKVKDIATLGL